MRDFFKYRGEKFWLQTTGRYYQSGDKTKAERLLHRRVWAERNGDIPDGYAVHHKDGDWKNNDIANLEIMPSQEHMRMHMLERWQDAEDAASMRVAQAKAREAAKAWHASPEGIAWHSENGKKVWVGKQRLESSAKCQHCAGDILTFFPTRAKFCSRSCSLSHAYQLNKTSERKCLHCDNAFAANKYRKTAFCSRTCSNRHRQSNKMS